MYHLWSLVAGSNSPYSIHSGDFIKPWLQNPLADKSVDRIPNIFYMPLFSVASGHLTFVNKLPNMWNFSQTVGLTLNTYCGVDQKWLCWFIHHYVRLIFMSLDVSFKWQTRKISSCGLRGQFSGSVSSPVLKNVSVFSEWTACYSWRKFVERPPNLWSSKFKEFSTVSLKNKGYSVFIMSLGGHYMLAAFEFDRLTLHSAYFVH